MKHERSRPSDAIPVYAVGFIQRADDRYLILRPTAAAPPGTWGFPRGRVDSDESPEAAMRRIVLEQAGLHVELDVGQPPVHVELDGAPVCFRCFLGGVVREMADRPADVEMQWVAAVQLLEFDFGAEYAQIIPWLADL